MFIDADPLEQDMKIRVEKMTADQLVSYFKGYHFGLNDVTIKVTGTPERLRMEWLIDTYGRADAGRIVKWSFWKHKGRWKGEHLGLMRYNAKMKWWVDTMHVEMQEQIAREERKSSARSFEGFATAADL